MTRGDKAKMWNTGAGCIIFLHTHLTFCLVSSFTTPIFLNL